MPFIVAHSLEEWISHFSGSRTVVTIGNFDGVHCGHQKIFQQVAERARHERCVAAALTFSPHPARVLRPEAAPLMVETFAQRIERMQALGLDAVFVLQFDAAVASMSPQEFVERILVHTLHARAVLVGENFRFGHRQTGDTHLLSELGRTDNFEVECVPYLKIRGTAVSSSAVRAGISAGQMERAARFLGRPFALAGEIRTGTGTGRRFVVPTLNLATEQELLPARGVYATEAIVNGKCYRAATNIGVRPTFDGTRRSIESHLFEFSEEITSGPLELRFWHRLREEQKFSGPEALREQIRRDLAATRSFFARLDAARRIARRTIAK